MTADDVREEIARAVDPYQWGLRDSELAAGVEEGWDGESWTRYAESYTRDSLNRANAILPILARREQEAYQRGRADAAQRVIAAWDAGWSAGASRLSLDNPHRRTAENGGQG